MVLNLSKRLKSIRYALLGVVLECLPLLHLEFVTHSDPEVQLTVNDSVISDKQNDVSWVNRPVVTLGALGNLLVVVNLGFATRHTLERAWLICEHTVAKV